MKLTPTEKRVLADIRRHSERIKGGLVHINTGREFPRPGFRFQMAASAKTMDSLSRKGLIQNYGKCYKSAQCRAVPEKPYTDIEVKHVKGEPVEPSDTIIGADFGKIEARVMAHEAQKEMQRKIVEATAIPAKMLKSRTHDKDIPVHMSELAEGYEHLVIPMKRDKRRKQRWRSGPSKHQWKNKK